MRYEINVSQNGRHLFATHERSITTLAELKRLYVLFADLFRESDGYELSVSCNHEARFSIDSEELMSEDFDPYKYIFK
jgi:hypothetical protein